MSKGFYKNRRLKSFIFLSACFLVAFIPHANNIENFFYIILTLSFVIVFYGLIVISRNFKRNNVLNTVGRRISNKELPVLDILVAARDEENVIARLVVRLFGFDYPTNKLNDDLWLLRGGGFGHGVGLSQSGAIEMAKLGFSYEQILNHYYRNAKLKKFENLSQWKLNN